MRCRPSPSDLKAIRRYVVQGYDVVAVRADSYCPGYDSDNLDTLLDAMDWQDYIDTCALFD